MMKVYVLKVDKDLCFFDVEGYRFWGELRKTKHGYTILNDRGQTVLRVNAYAGEILLRQIEKKAKHFEDTFRNSS